MLRHRRSTFAENEKTKTESFETLLVKEQEKMNYASWRVHWNDEIPY